MALLDWAIILIYISFLICLGLYLNKKQNSINDYFLGSKTLPWWGVGFSTMATQLGAISFISAPAFVGLRPGGGLIWLGYEFAVPLAMIFLIAVVIPLFHKSGIISIYEFLEMRFNRETRVFVSIVFLVSRGLATGISIYAVALVLKVILNIPLEFIILIIGAVALLYDYMGGIRAVIISDVIQMLIIIFGILTSIYYGLELTGGWSRVIENISAERLVAVDFSGMGIGGDSDFGFWPLLLGGFFLYTSYYGFDQSQVQREMSADSLRSSQKSLIFNALARFPIVLLYCLLGIIIGSFAIMDPEFMSKIPSDNIDLMIPTFIIHYLPAGITGIIITAILAASMSSMDSALNSLSASSMEDIIRPYFLKKRDDNDLLRFSRYVTLFWGLFCTLFALVSGNISSTVIESINMIGSIFYGPIAAVFVMGIFSRRVKSRHVITGGIAGVALNFILAAGIVKISWLWWNLTGFITALFGGLLFSYLWPEREEKEFKGEIPLLFSIKWVTVYLFLVLYCSAIILFSINIKKIFF
jgi:SSS family transporter